MRRKSKPLLFDIDVLIVPEFLTTREIRKVCEILDHVEPVRNMIQGWTLMRILLNFMSKNPLDNLGFFFFFATVSFTRTVLSYEIIYSII